MLYVGKIVDARNNPIEGAEINIKGYTGISNAQGLWNIMAPKFSDCPVEVRHRDYVLSTRYYKEIKDSKGVIRLGES